MKDPKKNSEKISESGPRRPRRRDEIFPETDRDRVQHVKRSTEDAVERTLLLWERVETACRLILPVLERADSELVEIYEGMLEALVEIGALTIDTPERQGLDLLRSQSSIARKRRPKWWNAHAIKFAKQLCQQGPIQRAILVEKTRVVLAKASADRKNENHGGPVPSEKTLDKFFAEHESNGSIRRQKPKKRKTITPQ